MLSERRGAGWSDRALMMAVRMASALGTCVCGEVTQACRLRAAVALHCALLGSALGPCCCLLSWSYPIDNEALTFSSLMPDAMPDEPALVLSVASTDTPLMLAPELSTAASVEVSAGAVATCEQGQIGVLHAVYCLVRYTCTIRIHFIDRTRESSAARSASPLQPL